jgi:phage baseplate assembly protein V
MRQLSRALAPLARGLQNLFSRGVVSAVNPGAKMQTVQIQLLTGESKDNVEHFEPYGYTAHPHAGAEQATGFVEGDRSHGIVLVVADRRYRLTGLAAGEVAIYDDQGQKVHLTRAGIVIDGAGLPMTITNTPKVRMETEMLECTGDIKDRCDSNGRTMDGMRGIYNGHDHPENDSGGPTDQPNQSM